jgi:hypothetical protein
VLPSSASFTEIGKEEVEQSIPDRFERMVQKYHDHVAVKEKGYALTYD